jgi:hypothetical protein
MRDQLRADPKLRFAPMKKRWPNRSMIYNCRSIATEQVGQVAGVLANLERSTSKYGLHDMTPGDLDLPHRLLTD